MSAPNRGLFRENDVQTDASIRPVLMAGLGVAFLSLLDASMKAVVGSYPLSQSVALRYICGSLFAVIAYLAMGGRMPTLAATQRNAIRSAIMICTAICFFTAIARLPLVEAITLTFLSPLFMAVLGRLILGEPMPLRTMVGIGIGLAGVAVIAHGQEVGDGDSFDPLGILAALGCAFFYALSMVLTRKQTLYDSTITIVALSNVGAAIFAAPVALLQWQPMQPTHIGLVLLAGLLGTGGHLSLAWAYKRAQAARLGMLEYTAFLWSMILGWTIFHEVPSSWTLAGSALIIGACLYGLTRK